jgi:hypothetical protein
MSELVCSLFVTRQSSPLSVNVYGLNGRGTDAIELFPGVKYDLTSVSVLLANTLASSGALQEASDVRWTLSQSGARKKAGLSWTEVNGKIEVIQFILIVEDKRLSGISSA